MPPLARQLRTIDYFALGWGTMVGVGWLVVMDDWLLRGGSLGAVLGFAVGGLLLVPIGYIYSRLVAAMPDAGGEIAYTARVFPRAISLGTGWMMTLAYWIVCPWEAVAVGRIAGYIFPALDSLPLYRIAGHPVYLPHLAVGLALTAFLTFLNYRGIRFSATFQNWTTFGTLALFVVFTVFGLRHGSVRNFSPLFTHQPLVSFLLVLQIVPYFMTGFESVGKAAEEKNPEFGDRGFFVAILASILVGVFFYTVVIVAVGYAGPWRDLAGERFMTAVVFERAVGSQWIASIILAAALLSLFKVFNGNLVAASRLVFALARRGLIAPRAGAVHPRHQTPAVAVLSVGLATAACLFPGDAILVPVTEVGSVAAACGWFAACAAYYRISPLPVQRAVALFGGAVALLMILMKVVPLFPGHFAAYEWLALAVWILLGLFLGHFRPGSSRGPGTS